MLTNYSIFGNNTLSKWVCVKNDTFFIKNDQLLIIFILNDEPGESKKINFMLFMGPN